MPHDCSCAYINPSSLHADWALGHRFTCKYGEPFKERARYVAVLPAAVHAASPVLPGDAIAAQRTGEPCPLVNIANNCYLNAVLQCLAHAPLLVAWVLGCDHARYCVVGPACALCSLASVLLQCTVILRCAFFALLPLLVLLMCY